MVTDRLPLLWAFAGGCLSGALLLGVWRAESEFGAHAPARSALHRSTEPRATPRADTTDDGDEPEAPPAEAKPLARSEHKPTAPNADPTNATAKPSEESDPVADQGASVADVLNRLETEYRQGLAVPPPASAPATAPASTAAAEAPPREVATRDEPAAQPAPPVAPPRAAPREPAPEPEAPLAEAPEVAPEAPLALPPEAAERFAARDVGQPQNVYLGDVQNNVYLGNVQNNVYQGQVVQMQQELAMLEYMQLLSLSPYARFGGRGRGVPRAFTGRSAPAPQLQSSLTNPDNPWGFDFPPTNYVK
ncbi:MAG TPA: hypothetical protein VMI54_10880 [Polyangiaceae bacterium]|nr:hypothetical protein [Polyangiaceae bacterium]